MISAGNNVAVGVSGDGDEILYVVGRRHQAVREEEGLKVGAFGRAESGDRLEADNNGLDDWRAVGEQGDVEEVDEVVPCILAPQDAYGEAGAPA